MSASDNLRDGLDYRLSLDTGGELDCETGTTLTVTTNMIETTCKGNVDSEGNPFKEFVPGVIGYNLTTPFNIELGESGVDVFDALEKLKDGNSEGFTLSRNGGGLSIAGSGTVNSLSIETNHNAVATGSVTINGDSPLTVTT